MEETRVVLVRKCKCVYYYNVDPKPVVMMKCDKAECRGEAPVEPEYTSCDGRQWSLVEEDPQLLKEKECICPHNGWINDYYDGTGVPRMHSVCHACHHKTYMSQLAEKYYAD